MGLGVRNSPVLFKPSVVTLTPKALGTTTITTSVDVFSQSTVSISMAQNTNSASVTPSEVASASPPSIIPSGLTMGAKLSLGLGIPFGTAFFFLLYLNLRRRNFRKRNTSSAEEMESHEKPELEGSRGGHELSETCREVEMDVEGARYEMAVAEVKQQLAAGQPKQELSSVEVAQEVEIPHNMVDSN